MVVLAFVSLFRESTDGRQRMLFATARLGNRSLSGRMRIACLLLFFAFGSAQHSVAQQEAEPQLTQQQRAELFAERGRLWESAQALDQQGKLREAVAAAEKMLAIERQLFTETDAELALSLGWIAERQEQLGQFQAALKHRREAFAIRQALLNAEATRTADARVAMQHVAKLASLTEDEHRQLAEARSLHQRAPRLYGEKKPNEALAALRQAAELYRKILGTEDKDTVSLLTEFAYVCALRGEFIKAESLYREVMGIQTKSLGKQHPDYRQTLTSLARVLSAVAASLDEQNDLADAVVAAEKALQIERQLYGDIHPEIAGTLDWIAERQEELENLPAAIRRRREALSIKEELFGAGDWRVTDARLAVEHAERLSKLTGEQRGRLRESDATNARVVELHGEGEYREAIPLANEVREIRKSVLGEKHPDYASSLNNLASLLKSQGDYARAEPLYRQALEIYKEMLGEKHPHYATSLNNLALLYRSQGDHAQAEPLYRQALSISLENLEAVASVQSERQQIAMTTDLRHQLDGYLFMAAHAGRYETSAYRQWLAWKGVVFARQQMVRAAAEEPKLKPLLEELRSVASRLATLAFATPDPEQREIWQRQVAELSKEKERLEAEMSRRSAAYREAKKQVTLEDLQAALPPDTALVDFVEVGNSFMEVGNSRLMAFVVLPEGDVKLLDLSFAEELNQAIDAWRESLGGSEQAGKAGLQLRKMLWEPLEPLLEGKKLVLVSPDGALGKLPLAALPGKEPGTYLLEERNLAV
ncbi:MAG: tetratricopeptide repeat protein, partial [Pirellulaceae bacterium]